MRAIPENKALDDEYRVPEEIERLIALETADAVDVLDRHGIPSKPRELLGVVNERCTDRLTHFAARVVLAGWRVRKYVSENRGALVFRATADLKNDSLELRVMLRAPQLQNEVLYEPKFTGYSPEMREKNPRLEQGVLGKGLDHQYFQKKHAQSAAERRTNDAKKKHGEWYSQAVRELVANPKLKKNEVAQLVKTHLKESEKIETIIRHLPKLGELRSEARKRRNG